MVSPIALGRSDFLKLRQARNHYVDKSLFVADLLRDQSEVVLLPRPRRFGKTLNLSTLRYFVERPIEGGARAEDVRQAFSGLEIETSGEDVWKCFQKHPVIFLTFKDVKGGEWTPEGAFGELLSQEAERHAAVVEACLTPQDQKRLAALVEGTASSALREQALRLLSQWLHHATGEKAFILIDEYDTPIHDAFADEKHFEKVTAFFRNFFSAGLKDNPHLEKGVLTGILRVAKESMFSGLNNIKVYSLLRKPFAASFGFTEEEVERLGADFKLSSAERETMRAWYNGYRFGGQVVYNPWSVLSFIDDAERQPGPYWVNTASDALIRKLLVDAGLGVESDLEALMAGQSIVKPIDEHIVLRDIDRKSEAVFSFLLMSGYLRADERLGDAPGAKQQWRLSIPNKEVATVYQGVFIDWLNAGLGGSTQLQAFCRALLSGDASAVEEHLGTLLQSTLSYHDTAGRAKEVVYQAFVAGLLVALDATHQVRSNRESGLGRADVLITPRKRGNPGVVMELKVLRASETMERGLETALEQVRAKSYAAELRAAGADPIAELAIVFDQKSVRVARGA